MRERANPLALLRRPDVQTEIRLDLKQRRDLDAIEQSQRTEIQARIQETFEGLQELTDEQRQQKMNEGREAMLEQIDQFQGEHNKKVDEILRPEQKQRLHELDLQIRGPFALNDPKVAEEAKIGSEHRTAIGNIYAGFQKETQDVREEFMQDMRDSGVFERDQPDGQPVDFRARFTQLEKKIEPLRKEAEKRILDVLSDEERARWTAIQGVKFTFRKESPARTGIRGR